MIARGGSVLLAGAVAQSLTLSPRVLEERRLYPVVELYGGGGAAATATVA